MSSTKALLKIELQRMSRFPVAIVFASMVSIILALELIKNSAMIAGDKVAAVGLFTFLFLLVGGASLTILLIQNEHDDIISGLRATFLSYPLKGSQLLISKILAYLIVLLPSVLIPPVVILLLSPFWASFSVAGLFILELIILSIIFISIVLAAFSIQVSRLRPLPEVAVISYFLFVAFYASFISSPKIYLAGSFLFLLSVEEGGQANFQSYAYAIGSVGIYLVIFIAALLLANRARGFVTY
jgi:hypothetical protein